MVGGVGAGTDVVWVKGARDGWVAAVVVVGTTEVVEGVDVVTESAAEVAEEADAGGAVGVPVAGVVVDVVAVGCLI